MRSTSHLSQDFFSPVTLLDRLFVTVQWAVQCEILPKIVDMPSDRYKILGWWLWMMFVLFITNELLTRKGCDAQSNSLSTWRGVWHITPTTAQAWTLQTRIPRSKFLTNRNIFIQNNQPIPMHIFAYHEY